MSGSSTPASAHLSVQNGMIQITPQIAFFLFVLAVIVHPYGSEGWSGLFGGETVTRSAGYSATPIPSIRQMLLEGVGCPVEPAGVTQVLAEPRTEHYVITSLSLWLQLRMNVAALFAFHSAWRGNISHPPPASSVSLTFVCVLIALAQSLKCGYKFGASLVKPGGRPQRPLLPIW